MKDISKLPWKCYKGNHIVFGGARYADHDGKHSCEDHTTYLK